MTFYTLAIFHFIRSSRAKRLRLWALKSDQCSNPGPTTKGWKPLNLSKTVFKAEQKEVRAFSSKGSCKQEYRQTSEPLSGTQPAFNTCQLFLKSEKFKNTSFIENIYLFPLVLQESQALLLKESHKECTERQENRNTEMYK